MESASLAEPVSTGIQVEDKGLKKNAISFLSNIVIGVASTAPAYSLAATLGGVAAFVAFGSPAVMIVAFIPMLMIAAAYYYMNRADPDCGTTFSWVTRAMGPRLGWMGGWAIIVTDIIVMPSLAAIAGQYTFQLFGNNNPSTFEVTLIGVIWIVVMTAICYIGIELSARTQQLLLGTEFVILMLFSVVALVKVYSGQRDSRPPIHVQASWFNPFDIHGFSNFTEAILLAVFIYWGWDSGVTVNEETENPGSAPGRAAVVSTFVLVGIYVLVAVAATAYAGPALLANNASDVFAPIGHSVLGSWRRQAADHRRADLGVRIDPDDDPAHRAHRALDVTRRGDTEAVRRDPPALPEPERRHAGDGWLLDRLVRGDDDRLHERARRLDPRARPRRSPSTTGSPASPA